MTPRLFDPANGDLARLASLHRVSFAEGWSAQAIAALLAGPGCFAFAGDDGWIMARVAAGEAEILTIAVMLQARRRGHGRALLRAAATHAASLGAGEMFLEVAQDNEAARALYGRAGFVPVGRRKGYYDGRDALILRAMLPLLPDGDIA